MIPHKCPVCGGNGLVANGFYRQTGGQWTTGSLNSDLCRACRGSGVVWTPGETVSSTSDNHQKEDPRETYRIYLSVEDGVWTARCRNRREEHVWSSEEATTASAVLTEVAEAINLGCFILMD